MRDGLPKKALIKANQELLELHQRCITTYLIQYHNFRPRKIKMFNRLYEHYITHKNIRYYFHRPIPLFVKALVLDKLEDIKDYYPAEPKRKTKKRRYVSR